MPDICGSCGFDNELPRRPVLICDRVTEFAWYLAMRCPECGHIRDGSTITRNMTPGR